MKLERALWPEQALRLDVRSMHAVKEALGNLDLAHERKIERAARTSDQRDLVVLRVEAGAGPRHIVGDDVVEILLPKFAPRPGNDIVRLGGEPDEALPLLL